MIELIDKRINRALNRIRKAFRGVITKVNAAPKVMLIQGEGLSDEGIQAAEYFQHYGFTSNPPDGAMFVCIPIGGKTAHGIVIATEHGSYRLKSLEKGELAIYDDQGQKVHIKRDRILIETTKMFEVVADKINLHAASEFKFDVNGQGEIWDGEGVETFRNDDVLKPTHNHAPPRIP